MPRAHHHGAFGDDTFGRGSEKVARFLGTPHYIIGQTLVVVVWIALNAVGIVYHWDPYPFILLNLAFSTQAAYAAPLILLAQTRQADRDKAHSELIDESHTRLEQASDERTKQIVELLQSNTSLTQQDKELTDEVARLTREIHAVLTQQTGR